MPTLRYRDGAGRTVEVLVDLAERWDGKLVPLTLGPGPESETNVHLPCDRAGSRPCTITGSAVSRSLVLSGGEPQVNGRPLEDIRVLRHGDRVRLGGSELVYLDFTIHRLGRGSAFVGRVCSLPGCRQKFAAEEPPFDPEEVVTCPWCAVPYHATCWLQLEQCATQQFCYPIRRMLLAELAPRVELKRLDVSASSQKQYCAARCVNNRLLEHEEVIRCDNPECGLPYHPGCWLSMRGPCPNCKADIPGLLDRTVFRLGGEGV